MARPSLLAGGADMAAELERLADATRMLAEVSTASGAWELARTAEAARRYAQMRNLGHESVNYATGIKAKAMLLLAGFVDQGQQAGTVRTQGRPKNVKDDNNYSLPELLGEEDANRARQAVHQARSLRDSLGDADIDELVREANESGEDLGIRGLKRMAAEKRGPDPEPEPVPVPPGVFTTLVADPPWQYENTSTRGAAQDHYDTLSIAQLCGDDLLPGGANLVKDVVAPKTAADAHLYLWATSSHLPEAFAVMAAWGFTYKTYVVWVKTQMGMGNYFRVSTELVLFGVRGSLRTLDMGLVNHFTAPRGQHSAKPQQFYDLAAKASPGPYLEMFGRCQRDTQVTCMCSRCLRGWEIWGNQA